MKASDKTPLQDYNLPEEMDYLDGEVSMEIHLDADPPETRLQCPQIAPTIEKLLKQFGVKHNPLLHELVERWSKLMAPEIAAVTRPGKIEQQILYVYVCNSMQLFNLRRQKMKEIEGAVFQFAGKERIRGIRLTVDPD